MRNFKRQRLVKGKIEYLTRYQRELKKTDRIDKEEHDMIEKAAIPSCQGVYNQQTSHMGVSTARIWMIILMMS
jgi:hypothetical protein